MIRSPPGVMIGSAHEAGGVMNHCARVAGRRDDPFRSGSSRMWTRVMIRSSRVTDRKAPAVMIRCADAAGPRDDP
jgi:hypothetical protein